MFAAGIVFVWLIYAALGLALCRALLHWYRAPPGPAKRRFAILSVVWAMALSGLAGRQYMVQKEAEAQYIGTYTLTDYPHCPTCILSLRPRNRYEVRQGNRLKEAGSWRYESGADYWIVYIGEDGQQLSSGRFRYKSN
jgi:hypothetical protein